MKRSRTTAALVATIGTLFLGLGSAQAFQQYTNVAIAMQDGATVSVPALASALCDARGFSGAQDFKFSGFKSQGGVVKAVFSSIKCTMVASRVVEAGDAAIVASDGTVTIRPSDSVKKSLNDAIQDGAKKNKIANTLNKHHKVKKIKKIKI